MTRRSAISRWLLPLLAVALSAILLLGALRTVRKIEQEKEAYLRSRAAGVAARLETLRAPSELEHIREALADEDPAVVGVELFAYDDPSSEAPAALREGRELFRVERARVDGEDVFRAWLPCHVGQQVFLARVDLSDETVAGLIRPAQQNVWAACAASLVVIALSFGLAWNARRAARAEQRQAELEHLARIGQLSAVLAHEIRNPLGTIKGFAQLLGERLRGAHDDLLAPVLLETTRLEQLVKDLLLYGRPPRVQLQTVDLGALSDRLRGHAARWMAGAAAEFSVDAPAVRLVSDPALLEQALLNLVRNAIEAVEDRPDARVRLSIAAPARSDVVIAVTDNGPGLSPDVERRLFEPFLTTKASGTGLGLAISRNLVTLLGGKLEIANRDEGGVTATVRLPQTPNGRATDFGG
ncbi:MAG: hypothetical protein KIT09_08070 [Bryobacteraceae bacterium]|nr:hypothetical protein [Bryobacteraceae bacterium]